MRAMSDHEHGHTHAPAAHGAAEWDARYEEKAAMWSGRVNGRLVAEVSDLVPGRALDVGCGEGADAIWLANKGWTVTGIDISAVAIDRAKEAARTAGVVVDFVAGDAMKASLPSGAFDLVSLQYPALPKAAGEGAVTDLLDLIGPGGLLLAVYHDLDEDHRAMMKDNGHDPDQYVWVDDLARMLGDSFEIEKHSTEDRIDPPEGTPHIADIVLRARRI